MYRGPPAARDLAQPDANLESFYRRQGGRQIGRLIKLQLMLQSILNNPVLFTAIKIAVAFGIVLSAVPMLVWMERKSAARFQRREGPNRVGPFGLLQSVADAIKLIFKEDYFPRNTDRAVFLLAPILTFLPGVISFGLVSVTATRSGQLLGLTNLNMGLLVML